MKKTVNLIFLTIMWVLSIFCWCPIGYGKYGPVSRILGVPYWAFCAFIFAIILFIVEWIYLFGSKYAIKNEDVSKILREISLTENPKE